MLKSIQDPPYCWLVSSTDNHSLELILLGTEINQGGEKVGMRTGLESALVLRHGPLAKDAISQPKRSLNWVTFLSPLCGPGGFLVYNLITAAY